MPQSLGPPIAPAPRAPTYTEIAHAVRMLDGESAKRVRDMMNAIFELANTQPDSIDWANPDHWINERLSGDVRRLARKIWEGSGKTLNPRYLYGHYKIINRLKLLELVDSGLCPTILRNGRARPTISCRREDNPCRADGLASVQAPRFSTNTAIRHPARRISGAYSRANRGLCSRYSLGFGTWCS